MLSPRSTQSDEVIGVVSRAGDVGSVLSGGGMPRQSLRRTTWTGRSSLHRDGGIAPRARLYARTHPLEVAVLAAAAVLLVVLVVVWSRPVQHAAEARVLIVPAQTTGDVPVTSLDTLSRGTVVDTFAEILSSRDVRSAAYASAQLPTSTDDDVRIETRVVAGTSIVRVVATAREAEDAEAAADALAGYRPDLQGYTAAFVPLRVATAQGTAESAGPSRLVLSAALLAAALANAVLVTTLLRRRRRPPEEYEADLPRADETAPGSPKPEARPTRLPARR